MITDTRHKIIFYIKQNKQVRVHDLVKVLGISNVAVHKQLKGLIENGVLRKVGRPPTVFYVLDEQRISVVAEISDEVREKIDSNYLYISPRGELLYGFEGFRRWSETTKQEKRVVNLASEYFKTLEDMRKYITPNGWVDATEKLKNTFRAETKVDKLLYADFYSLPKFGKTKLGQLVLYSKQSQKRELMGELGNKMKPLIEKIVRHFSINAVAFIPPTIPRKLQFMSEFVSYLDLSMPVIELVKVAGEVAVAQKTLSSLEERITNARETIYLKHIAENLYPNVLLIDDAVGSGSSFNETAKKLKGVGIGRNKIIAFAIIGSFKGFDVIREV